MDYMLTLEDGSSAFLAHHGIKGMKWGVWNSETRARFSGNSKPKRSTAAPTARAKRIGRIQGQGRMGEIGGKTYKQSYKTAKAQRKAAKYLLKSVESPSAANTIKASTWENKAKYEHYRDIGRSSGTRKAKIAGNTATAVGAISLAGGLTSANLPLVTVGAASIASGRIAVKKAIRREYKSGYRYATGRKEISQEKMEKVKNPRLND